MSSVKGVADGTKGWLREAWFHGVDIDTHMIPILVPFPPRCSPN